MFADTCTMNQRPLIHHFLHCASFALCTVFLAGGTGCNGPEPGVVLYTDQEPVVVELLKKQIQPDVRVPIRVVYAKPEDTQSGIGLSQRLREERGAFKADVYWAGNQLAMQKLVDDGILQKTKTSQTMQYPVEVRDTDFRWIGLNGRVRVILYHKRAVPRARVPKSLASLKDPAWKGRAVYADPRKNGSARYHLVTLFALASEMDGKELMEDVVKNQVQFLPDEKAVVEAVASGKAAWGITDSDLAEAAMRAGNPVDYVVTDQESGSTAKAMGIPAESLPTLGTPLIVAPVGLFRERPARGEGEHLFNAMVKLSTATTLATRIQPDRFPTHQSLIASPPPGSKNKIKDPLSLRLAQPSPDKINEAQTLVSLVVPEVLK